MAEINSPGLTASRAALVAMTRVALAFCSLAWAAKRATAVGGIRDGFGPQPMRLVKTAAEPRLVASLEDRPDVAPGDVGHEQLHRIGADIDDGPANGWHADD